MTQNKKDTGSYYEEMAAAFLKKRGYSILEQNYRCKSGEIDIIARDGSYLVFVEVKYRASHAAGYAVEAVDKRKAAKIRHVAEVYLYTHRYAETTPCRFDVAGIDGDRITYIENAF